MRGRPRSAKSTPSTAGCTDLTDEKRSTGLGSPQNRQAPPSELVLTVASAAAGTRLDQFLADRLGHHTRSQWKRRIEAGEVFLGGQPGKPAMRLREGDEIAVCEAPPVPLALVPEAIPLAILYEDEALIVVDKAAGMVVHPAPGWSGGTLVHALIAHCPNLPGIGGALRPGIVHRLDKDTSGLLVVAKTEAILTTLAAGFRAETKAVSRTYLALVAPPPSRTEGRYETFYGRDPANRKKWTSRRTGGKRAITRYRVLETLADNGAALVEAVLETGRTHQIRVHFRDHGHPVLGDRVYGRLPKDPAVRAVATALGRQALHAHRLAFRHPETGVEMVLTSPLPADLEKALSDLRANTKAKP